MSFAPPRLSRTSFAQTCGGASASRAVCGDRHRDPCGGTYIENDCSGPFWAGGGLDASSQRPAGMPRTDRNESTLRHEAEFLESPVPCQVRLLPRHWNWLCEQSDGVSVTLQQLVENARTRRIASSDEARSAREAAYRALRTLAGDAQGFDDACCALFAGDREAFERHTAHWPRDVIAYGLRLAAPGWQAAPSVPEQP